MNTKTFLARTACTGLFAALVSAAPPLKAQDFRLGAGVSLVNPYGDLADGTKLGFGVSFFGEMGITQSQALRGRVDYALFGKKDIIICDSSATSLSVFADYILRLESNNEGLYAFAGLGIVNATWKLEFGGISVSTSKSKLGYSAGAGYNISKNLGIELSLTASSTGEKSAGVDDEGFIDFNWVQVSLKYRF